MQHGNVSCFEEKMLACSPFLPERLHASGMNQEAPLEKLAQWAQPWFR